MARRASAILYHVVRSRGDVRPLFVPANVCPIVPETLAAAHQPFELVDISAPSLEIDAAGCMDLLLARADDFSGILFVRPYGSERDPTAFFERLRGVRADLLIIDDRCLSPPDCAGTTVSPLADVTLFSTGRAKYADLGGGGFAHIRDDFPFRPSLTGPHWLDLGPQAMSWKHYRLNTEEATRRAVAQKTRLNAIYTDALPPTVQLSPELQQWRFNILVQDPDALVAAIFEAGLFASRHYPAPVRFPVAASLHAHVVNLFNDHYFDEERAHRVSEVVLRHLEVTRS